MTVALPATLDEIETAICLYFRVTPDDLRWGRRESQAYVRRIFYYVAREITRFSMQEIGEQLGFTHSAASHSIARLQPLLSDTTVRSDILSVRKIVAGEPVEPAGIGHVMSARESVA